MLPLQLIFSIFWKRIFGLDLRLDWSLCGTTLREYENKRLSKDCARFEQALHASLSAWGFARACGAANTLRIPNKAAAGFLYFCARQTRYAKLDGIASCASLVNPLQIEVAKS